MSCFLKGLQIPLRKVLLDVVLRLFEASVVRNRNAFPTLSDVVHEIHPDLLLGHLVKHEPVDNILELGVAHFEDGRPDPVEKDGVLSERRIDLSICVKNLKSITVRTRDFSRFS